MVDPNKGSFLDNLQDKSLSPRPSSIMNDIKSGDIPAKSPLYPWVKSLILIRSLGRNSADKPEIDGVYPAVV